MKQVNIIDSLRAFAAISVCIFHFVCTTTGLEYPATMTALSTFGQYGVHIFFVISGFIIPWSMYYKNYRIGSMLKFMAKRLIRLEPPYLASILLILIIAFIKTRFHIGAEAAEAITPARIGLHFGYLINFFPEYKWLNNVYWTLAIEFQYYLIMSFLYLLFVHKSLWLRVLAYALCFGMAWFVSDASNKHFPAYAPLFLFGIIVFQYKANLVGSLECAIIIVACFVYNYAVLNIPTACFGLSTALVILFFAELKIPVLDRLGKMSYSIYLIHPVIGAAVINILSRYAHTTIQKLLILLAGLIVTFASSYLMYLLIEKPSKKLSSKIKL
jgi:peptidoglycan/LPS O-acetylase OafA/YrhL